MKALRTILATIFLIFLVGLGLDLGTHADAIQIRECISVNALRSNILKNYDVNRDRVIGPNETRCRTDSTQTLDAFIGFADVNLDGALTRGEIEEAIAIFDNGDGNLDAFELTGFIGSVGTGPLCGRKNVGKGRLPTNLHLALDDTFALLDAFAVQGCFVPSEILSVVMEGSSWRLAELAAGTAFTVTQEDCDHVGNLGVGRDRIFVEWRNADGTTDIDDMVIRYCDG